MASGSAVTVPGSAPIVAGEMDLRHETMRRVSLRLLPLLFALFVCNYIDRTNIAMAKLQMDHDLGFTDEAYAFGASIFFVGYILFEVPSNLILARVGARRWIARIMISWGLVATAMMFIRTPLHFYTLRVLLGFTEAGFFPGIVYYLGQWFPAAQRARAISRFMIGIPLAGIVGNPLSGWLLELNGRSGLRGWQWVFLVEGVLSVVLGLAVLAVLTERPNEARWLSVEQRAWLAERLAQDQDESSAPHGLSAFRALVYPTVWLVALPFILGVAPFYSYLFWAPDFVQDTLHVSAGTTGYITGASAFVSAAAMLATGVICDRTGERCLSTSAAMLLAAIGYTGAALLPSPTGRVAGIVLVNIGVMSFPISFWSVSSTLLRGTAGAAGIALVNSIGNIGGLAGPFMIGLLKDSTGSTSAPFLVLAAMALVAAAFFAAYRKWAAFASPGVRGIEPGSFPATFDTRVTS
jgi:ACS family tartrate transporter-like MFS transporter